MGTNEIFNLFFIKSYNACGVPQCNSGYFQKEFKCVVQEERLSKNPEEQAPLDPDPLATWHRIDFKYIPLYNFLEFLFIYSNRNYVIKDIHVCCLSCKERRFAQ